MGRDVFFNRIINLIGREETIKYFNECMIFFNLLCDKNIDFTDIEITESSISFISKGLQNNIQDIVMQPSPRVKKFITIIGQDRVTMERL